MKTLPRPYQDQHSDSIVKKYEEEGIPFAGLLYKPGRGKTLTSLLLYEKLYKKNYVNSLFIIVPKNGVKTWKDQIAKHSELSSPYNIWNSIKHKSDRGKKELRFALTMTEMPIFIISCESLQRYNEILMNTIEGFFHTKKVMLVIDESAKFKNGRSKRTENLFEFSRDVTFRIILNGTPTPKSIVDIWAQMEALKKIFWKEGRLSTFEYKYTTKMFIRSWDGKSGYEKIITWSDVNDMKAIVEDIDSKVQYKTLSDNQINLKAKLEAQIENLTIELTRKDMKLSEVQEQIAPYVYYADREEGVPPVTPEIVYFELTDKERKVYNRLKNQKEFIDNNGERITFEGRSNLFQKFRQISGGSFDKDNQIEDIPSKVDAIIDDIETHEENILILTSYRKNIQVLTDALSKIGPTSSYFGDTTEEERDLVVDKARKNQLRFIVANSDSIGLSVDGLQESFHIIYVYDLPISPLTWEQVVFRLDRSGQKYPVLVKHFIANKTIDKRCLDLANDHKNIQEAFEAMSEEEFEEAVGVDNDEEN